MVRSPERFAQLLTQAVYRIRFQESKLIQAVQDELGYALEKAGGSAVEYWRKGHIPSRMHELEDLTRELARRGGLPRQEQMEQLLLSGGHPDAAGFATRWFEEEKRAPVRAPSPRPRTPQPDAGPPIQSLSSEDLAPFVVGPPIMHPRQFFGREAALKRIYDLWSRFPLQNVAVVGPHRSGKTSLLHYLKTITTASPEHLRPGQRTDWLPQPARYQWVLVDFQDARMCSRQMLLAHLLNGLNIPVPDPCDLPRFMEAVSRHLRDPALILMDEIGVALQSPDLDLRFWWSLRSLACNQTGGNLAFLLTSHEPPGQLAQERGKPSPFFNIFGHTLNLGPLSEEEAGELLASAPQTFAHDDGDWILAQSGRWPALLQILCNTHLSWLEGGRTDEEWKDEGLRQLTPYSYLLGEG